MATTKKIASHLTEIPDHLLTEILLRLPTADDLARTSAACVSFRRLVTDASFLRSFRRLHAPPFLGFLDRDGFHPAQPPHPSAPAARALALAADFSFSFLPSERHWTVRDTRDGRVLLNGTTKGQERPVFTELVVCDPLHRRYVLLPPVPSDLHHMVPCEPFLAPLSKEETAEDTAFRVICMGHSNTKMSAFIFSSSTGEWRAATSKAWGDLFLGQADLNINRIRLKMFKFFLRRHYAYGCFYWDGSPLKCKKLIFLHTRRMEFSLADLPHGKCAKSYAVAEAGDGRLGVFGLCGGRASCFSYTIAQNEGEGPSQFQMRKTTSLHSGYKYCIINTTGRYLLLARTKKSYVGTTVYFSMDINTLKLQRVCAKQGRDPMWPKDVRIYTNFPPSLLSSPTI